MLHHDAPLQAALPPTRISQLPERQQQQQQPAACRSAGVPPGAEDTSDDAAGGQGSKLAAGGVDAASAKGNGGAGRRLSGSGGGTGSGAGGGERGGDGDGGDDDDSRLAALESEYVHKVYDAIAPHFSATRYGGTQRKAVRRRCAACPLRRTSTCPAETHGPAGTVTTDVNRHFSHVQAAVNLALSPYSVC